MPRGNKTKATQTALDAAGLQSGANVRETTGLMTRVVAMYKPPAMPKIN